MRYKNSIISLTIHFLAFLVRGQHTLQLFFLVCNIHKLCTLTSMFKHKALYLPNISTAPWEVPIAYTPRAA